MSDRVSRIMLVTSLALSLVALGLAAHAVSLAGEQEQTLSAIAESIEALSARRTSDLPMHAPPPELETDDY